MAYTFTETVGIIQAVIAYMEDADNQAALTAKDFDVTPHLTRLKAKLATINKCNTEQEALKVALSKKTTDLNTATDGGYNDTSGLIDAMAGMLGKGTPEAKNLQTIRSKVRAAGGNTPTPPAPPQ